MTTISTSTTAHLRRSVEGRDADAILGLYADDATIEIVDVANPPSSPRRLNGRAEIEAHLRDVYAREMSHEVDLVAQSGDALAYAVRCAYPDGTRVLCSAIGQLRDGRIVREVVVQAWDA
jgi:ketosteroid isomerase-like protein